MGVGSPPWAAESVAAAATSRAGKTPTTGRGASLASGCAGGWDTCERRTPQATGAGADSAGDMDSKFMVAGPAITSGCGS